MASISFIMDASKPSVLFLVESKRNHVTAIPYRMDSYQLLLSYLSEYIPEDWQVSIKALLQEERKLIARRQALMVQYKATLQELLPEHIAEFQKLHPEFFI